MNKLLKRNIKFKHAGIRWYIFFSLWKIPTLNVLNKLSIHKGKTHSQIDFFSRNIESAWIFAWNSLILQIGPLTSSLSTISNETVYALHLLLHVINFKKNPYFASNASDMRLIQTGGRNVIRLRHNMGYQYQIYYLYSY